MKFNILIIIHSSASRWLLASIKKVMLLMVEVEERLHLVSEEDSPKLEAKDEQNQVRIGDKYQAIFLMAKIEERFGFATEEYSTKYQAIFLMTKIEEPFSFATEEYSTRFESEK